MTIFDPLPIVDRHGFLTKIPCGFSKKPPCDSNFFLQNLALIFIPKIRSSICNCSNGHIPAPGQKPLVGQSDNNARTTRGEGLKLHGSMGKPSNSGWPALSSVAFGYKNATEPLRSGIKTPRNYGQAFSPRSCPWCFKPSPLVVRALVDRMTVDGVVTRD